MFSRDSFQRVRFLAGIGAAAASLLMAGGWADSGSRWGSNSRSSSGSDRASRPAVADAFWKPGVARAIAVRDGRASFRVAAPASSQTLVVVSALSRSAGPFAVRLAAHPAPSAAIPMLAGDGPRPDVPSPSPLPAPAPARDPRPVAPVPPRRRTFHMMIREGDSAVSGNYAPVVGVLEGVGRRIQVYIDSEDAGAIDRGLVADLVSTFDDRIEPRTSAWFGGARDLDGDGRFTILLSSRLGRLAGGRHAVDGFVRVADLDPSLPSPFGNHCDMVYLNAALAPGPYARTVLAHEYMHVVAYNRKCASRAAAGDGEPWAEEEGWLDEAIAHLAEDLHGFSTANLDYRISAFLSRPESYRLVVEDYFAADLFRSHGNRGSTYLFLRWCVDRYGPGLLPALVHSPRRGVANLEAATGSTFADLYRRWSLALFLSGMDPPGESPAASGDGFRTIRLRAPLADWELAGPRYTPMIPGGPAECWEAAGTGSHFAVIAGSATGAVDVEAVGPSQAQLQVTALPLGTDRARLALSLRPSLGPNGVVHIRAEVAEQNGVPVRISAMAWEPLIPGPCPQAEDVLAGRLDKLGVADAFGTSAVPGHGTIHSRTIPLSGLRRGDGPMVVKVVGTDTRGRRVSAWADLEPVTKP